MRSGLLRRPRSARAAAAAHKYARPASVATCGHTAHVGTCPACQRRRKLRHAQQLAAAQLAAQAWATRQGNNT